MLPNYHTHTRFCDGADSPEELILEALRLGCPEIGFSGHSYIEGENWCMSAEGTEQYIREICRLKEQYRDRIRIRLGIEQDILSDIDRNRSLGKLLQLGHSICIVIAYENPFPCSWIIIEMASVSKIRLMSNFPLI